MIVSQPNVRMQLHAKCLMILLVLSALHVQIAVADTANTLESPRGGWNYSGMTDRAGEARVAYPTPPIDRGAQRNRTLILSLIHIYTHIRHIRLRGSNEYLS